MTWTKATPVLAAAGIFDLIRIIFESFWFFGPALIAAYCTAQAGEMLSTLTFGLLGVGTAGAACSAGAVLLGIGGASAFAMFGVVMAIAVGFLGWLTVGGILIATNARIFKEDESSLFWFAGSLLISEIPFIGALPSLSGAMVKLYSAQIKRDAENVKKYQQEQVAEQKWERNQKIIDLARFRAAQEEEIPEERDMAA